MNFHTRVFSRLILVFLLVALPFSAGAQELVRSFVVLPQWEVGQTVNYELIKIRKKIEAEAVKLHTTARTDLQIEVLDSNEQGYKLAWKLGETRFDNPDLQANPIVKQMANLLKGYRVILELDQRAAISGVVNWRELKKLGDELVVVMTQSLQANGVDQQTVDNLRLQVASMFSTEEQIAQMVTREAQIMFMAIGVELDRNQPLIFQDRLYNPFGGDPFPTRCQFSFQGIDEKSGHTTINWTQQFIPEDAKRIMEASLEKMAKRLGNPIQEQEELLGFTIEDEAKFFFETVSGWPFAVMHTRRTKAGNQSQEDTVKIQIKVE